MSDWNAVSEKDWDLLNAFADGELSATEGSKLEARLAREPELEFALSRIIALKTDLGILKPAPPSQRRAKRFGPPMLAALLLIAAFSLAWVSRPSPPGNALDLHAVLSGMAVEQIPELEAHGALDFSASDLELIGGMVAEGPNGPLTAWHYRGKNGCAITFVSGSGLDLAGC